MLSEKLAKIKNVSFGIGGYQDAMVGFNFVLGNKDWDVQDFKTAGWLNRQPPEPHIRDLIGDITTMLVSSNSKTLNDLIGKPVLCFFDNDKLIRWRILDEVL